MTSRTRTNVEQDLILSMWNLLDGRMVVVCYWSISCEWQVDPALASEKRIDYITRGGCYCDWRL